MTLKNESIGMWEELSSLFSKEESENLSKIIEDNKKVHYLFSDIAEDFGIEINSKVLNGTPIIKDTKVSICKLISYFKNGLNIDEISEKEHLKKEQIESSLDFIQKLLNS